MPTIICGGASLTTNFNSCITAGGVKEVKIIPFSDINFTTINTALATYFNSTTLTFTSTQLPLVASKFWYTLRPDAETPQRDSVSPEGGLQWNVNIQGLRFKGSNFNRADIEKLKRSNQFVVATLYNDNTLIIDGLAYNELTDKLELPYSFKPMRLGEITSTSSTFGDVEVGANLIFSLVGSQPHEGYLAAFTYAGMVTS